MADINSDGQCSVFWPSTARQVQAKALAPRLDTLEGKTIALLWGYLFRGDEAYGVIETALKEQYPGVKFISWEAFGSIHGNDEHRVVATLPARLRELGADAVLTAMGC